MAPRKQSTSSASTRKTSKSSASKKSVGSSRTSTSTTSPTKVTKPRVASPRKLSTIAKEQLHEEAVHGKTSPRKKTTTGKGRYAHFDSKQYPLLEEGSGTDVDDDALLTVMEPLKPNRAESPRKAGRPSSKTSKTPDLTAFLSARPNKPSFEPSRRGPRAVGKPDPAAGDSYELKNDNNETFFDQRETYGYLLHYEDLLHDVSGMQESILKLAGDLFGGTIATHHVGKWLEGLDEHMTDELERYAGFIAVGGPCGVAGWEEVFVDSELRIALIAGLIWTALKQSLFEAHWFGADDDAQAALEDNEWAMKSQDCGFMRNTRRSNLLRGQRSKVTVFNGKGFPDTANAEVDLVAGIIELIEPLHPKFNKSFDFDKAIEALASIVHKAVELHHCIRIDRDTIYSWALTLKDWPYNQDFARMSSADHFKWLMDPANRAAHTVADDKLTQAQADRVRKYACLSRIVVFDPLEAYKKGGWRQENGRSGMRRKLICKGAVACRWGATRQFGDKLKPGAGNFLELRECRGKLGKDYGGKAWWETKLKDPALAKKVVDVPILGQKGEGQQKDLEGFKPRQWTGF